MASRCRRFLATRATIGNRIEALRCLEYDKRSFGSSERCNCGIKNGKSMEAKNNTMISMKPKVLNTIRPSLLYLNTGRISASRTFFSTPFDAVFKGKKKEFSERKVLGFSMDHMFEVVANVDDYKFFVPWCRDSKIIETKPGHLRALLEVGFPPLIERYTSILTLVRPNLVKSECIDGEMFNYMKAVWRFSKGVPGNRDSCTLNFHIAFEFKSALHSHLATLFFDEVVKKMVQAFESRCEQIHGSSFPSKALIKRPRRNPPSSAGESS